jgi:DNA mismatch repair ATPase MutS
VFAELAAPPAHLQATDLAHPLLPAAAVANTISLGHAAPSLLIVSGSNMSGKSTFLRALGVNVVLAQMGAPVRASSFRLAPLAVGASIRVLDSLQEGHSRFYAEILRLKHIVDLARGRGGATLFLLDEVLGGTNSHDRRQGAEGLLRGLIGLGAIGLATTHDLALGEIADGWSPQAANVHFADAFDGGSLAFDYVLREGPVRTSNALALMRSIGLDVDTV